MNDFEEIMKPESGVEWRFKINGPNPNKENY